MYSLPGLYCVICKYFIRSCTAYMFHVSFAPKKLCNPPYSGVGEVIELARRHYFEASTVGKYSVKKVL